MLRLRNFVHMFNGVNGYSTVPQLRPVTHVIFDMDGLILDTEKLYKKTIASVLASFGKEYSADLRLAVLGTKAEDTAKIIVESLNLPVSPEEFGLKAKSEQIKVMGQASVMPGAERLIKHLHAHNIPIAVATSSSEENFRVKTAKYTGLFGHFHHIVKGSSDPEVVNGKPAPDIFLIAARRFSKPADPQKCLVLEDAPNGVRGARDAGMQVVMVPEEYIPDNYKKEATLVIDSLLNFRPELFGLPPFPPGEVTQ